jgi:prevent-host-death family protein
MPTILPIRDLKNTARISELCKTTDEPIFITKNGYGEIVVMGMAHYEKTLAHQEVFRSLDAAERQIAAGQVRDASESLAALRRKHHV